MTGNFMEWSKQKPMLCGEYWYKYLAKQLDGTTDNEIKIVSLQDDENGNPVALFPGFARNIPVENMNGEWSGPLRTPSIKAK